MTGPASSETMFNLKRPISSALSDTTDNILDEQRQEAAVPKGYRFITTLLGFFIHGRDANRVHCSSSCLPESGRKRIIPWH